MKSYTDGKPHYFSDAKLQGENYTYFTPIDFEVFKIEY